MPASGHGLSSEVLPFEVGEMSRKARIVVWEVLAIAQAFVPVLYVLGRVLVRGRVSPPVRNLRIAFSRAQLRVVKLASRVVSSVCRVLGRAVGSRVRLRWKKVLYIVVWVVVWWVGGRALLVL